MESFGGPDVTGPQRGRLPYLPDLHLKTAIRISERELLLKLHQFLQDGNHPKYANVPHGICYSLQHFKRGRKLFMKELKLPDQIQLDIHSEKLYGSLMGHQEVILESKLEKKRMDNNVVSWRALSYYLTPAVACATGRDPSHPVESRKVAIF